MKRIFVSSVQKEFANVRGLLKRYVSKNPAYRRLFDTFVFEEDVVAKDRRADEVYLDELEHWIGVRNESVIAPSDYDIPRSVVLEAIVNGIAHRDYTSNASVQVELFPDKLLVMSPGKPHPSVDIAGLDKPHPSNPVNPLIADALYRTGHIERLGTGLEDLFKTCRKTKLPKPKIEMVGGTFFLTIFRNTSVIPPIAPTTDATTDNATDNATETSVAGNGMIRLLQHIPKETDVLSLMHRLGLRNKRDFLRRYITPALAAGLIERTIPDKPTSRFQKYRLTPAGRATLNSPHG